MRNGHHFILSHHQKQREENNEAIKSGAMRHCWPLYCLQIISLPLCTHFDSVVDSAGRRSFLPPFLWIGFFSLSLSLCLSFSLPISLSSPLHCYPTHAIIYMLNACCCFFGLFVWSPSLYIYHLIYSVRSVKAPHSISKQSLVCDFCLKFSKPPNIICYLTWVTQYLLHSDNKHFLNYVCVEELFIVVIVALAVATAMLFKGKRERIMSHKMAKTSSSTLPNSLIGCN